MLGKAIAQLDISPRAKFTGVYLCSLGTFLIKHALKRPSVRGAKVMDVPLAPSNSAYGHEHWLKKYSGFKGRICASIEHGVGFGDVDFMTTIPIGQEWQIGSFITYGEYRRTLLGAAYPHHRIYEIGPYIQYAETSNKYRDTIRLSKSNPQGRTLTLFPAHSVSVYSPTFDVEKLIASTRAFATKLDCENILVCMSAMDNVVRKTDAYSDAGFQIVTCGQDKIDFLPRQRSIFSESDVTVSNSLGTHVGYSLAMGVPHYIIDPIPATDGLSVGGAVMDRGLYIEQRMEFYDTFAYRGSVGITPFQMKLGKHYWGLGIVRSRHEMKGELVVMKSHYSAFARNPDMWRRAGS